MTGIDLDRRVREIFAGIQPNNVFASVAALVDLGFGGAASFKMVLNILDKKETFDMSTETQTPHQMLESIADMAARGVGTDDAKVASSVLEDIIDECVRFQGQLTLGAGAATGSREGSGVDLAADRVEQILAMVADTHTKTGAVLAVLERAGLLDDVARGVTAAPKAIVRGVKAIKAARKKGTQRSSRVMAKAAARRTKTGSKAR